MSDRPVGSVTARVVLASYLAGGALCVVLVAAGPPSYGADPGGLVTVTRISGVLAQYSAIGQLVLMARLPLLERRLRSGRILAWHRVNGAACAVLIAVHAATAVVGYAAAERTAVAAELARLVLVDAPGLSAAVGAVAFLAVGISSARAARRRMTYEAWFTLHLYAYLAVALSAAHQLTLGTDLRPGWPRLVWWATLLGTVAALLGYRAVLPVIRSLASDLRVSQVRGEATGVVSVTFRGHGLHRFRARSGQYFQWRFLRAGMWTQAHPYSLSAAPTDSTMRITVRGDGDASRAIAGLRPGARVIAEGPFGDLQPDPADRPAVLIGAGIAITPLRALAESLVARCGSRVDIVYRVHDADRALFRDEFAELERTGRARLHVVSGSRGDETDLDAGRLRALVPDLPDRVAYLCGPPQWLSRIHAQLRDAGLPRHRIHDETFLM